MEELRGWLSGSKGRRYLATDEGWFELLGRDGAGLQLPADLERRPARVAGERQDGATFIVDRVINTAAPTTKRGAFAVSPPLTVHLAARARAAADRFLWERGFPQVMLPSLWTVSREYGEEELSVSHPGLTRTLALLQSPEFPMFASLAMGIDSFYCWGRSYRQERESSDRHLMEFEQIDVGFSHGSLQEILDLVEALVRAVAADLGIAVEEAPFPSRREVAPRTGPGMSVLELNETLPREAVEIILRRLREVGAEVFLMRETPPVIAISDQQGPEVATAVANVLDSVQRLAAAGSSPRELRPWWRSPLPLQWDSTEEASQSEYKIRTITSARISDAAGIEWIEEAELYINGLEVAHAGVFADQETFLRNLDEAHAPRERYEWLIPHLADAPPGMVKVGVGWERLISALLGGSAPTGVQLFPRLGDGNLAQEWML